MNRYILAGCLFLLCGSLMATIGNAQKLINGGKPKPVEVKDLLESYCINLPNTINVCKGKNPDEESNKPVLLFIRQNSKKLGEIEGTISAGGGMAGNFFAFYGDLDKNNSAELIIVDFDGQSNGLGVNYYTINIFPDFQTKGFQPPISFSTSEFGTDGTFLYDSKLNETLILLTEWGGVQIKDAKRPGNGLYFTGRFFRYHDGKLKLAVDKPILARRYLNSFEKERFRTDKNPQRPFIWLTSPNAIKLTTDPVFAEKPVSTQSGVIVKFEELTEKHKDEGGNNEDVFLSQLTVRLDSGETKTIVISKRPDYISLPDDNDKILPETFGILPAKLTFPNNFNPKFAFDELEGKRVQINSYKGIVEGTLNYSLWFIEK